MCATKLREEFGAQDRQAAVRGLQAGTPGRPSLMAEATAALGDPGSTAALPAEAGDVAELAHNGYIVAERDPVGA